ncbi:MAG: MBL fold metallo-hydrolase [Pseudomonadota bacterium]
MKRTAVVMALALAVAQPAIAQNPMENVEIEVQQVGEGLYMLIGRGGNLGLSVGEDATFLIDDQFAPLTDKIIAAVATVTDRPIDYVLNTHWHFDHTGGNENLGDSALIMAHDNVRKRMAAGQFLEAFQMQIDPAPDVALPALTFNDTLTLHANGLTIRGFHIEHAHTDGDTLVHFEEANVVHMGDTFFNGIYPFLDVESGGDIDGLIEAADAVLAIADEDTNIIPGHGPLADRDALLGYRAMLSGIRDAVAKGIAEDMSLEEIQATGPSAPFDAEYGDGFMPPERFVAAVYVSLTD